MTATSTDESRQHRLHWLAEHVINWSGIPRSTSGRPSFWTTRCSPHCRAVDPGEPPARAAVRNGPHLTDRGGRRRRRGRHRSAVAPRPHRRGLRTHRTRRAEPGRTRRGVCPALGRPIHAVRLPYAEWLDHLDEVGLDSHVQQHIATMPNCTTTGATTG